MVDFSKLSPAGSQAEATSLFDTFSRLDRQVSHVELRPSQLDLFKKIDGQLNQRDLVLKLNTGGGKTTTGLIYLKHMMDRYDEPVVFLVPTTQLAEQVIDEGERIGLSVVAWLGNERYPPEQASQCNSVMVCTYDKFFNGKSTFARADVRLIPCAIVLDDVHAGIESIKKCFGAVLPEDVRAGLLSLLGPALSEAEPANWSRVEGSDPAGLLEVPHWLIADNISAIRSTLSAGASEKPLVFSWPHISRALELCRIVISGNSAEITLDPPLTDYVEHYVGARHRLFMSASIHDGGPLIRELGCDQESIRNPIEVEGEGAVGERMVLVPSLVDPQFTRAQIIEVVARFVPSANVVVLVSSDAAAGVWVEAGAVKAQGDNFSSWIETLKGASRGNFIVFVNRYDGIDLPDAACRILVIDGLPAGEGVIDRLDNENAGGLVGMRGKLANRVEQGLGRAVRSNSDYCAVILAGQDLANFISRKIVLESFSPNTVRQIEIGREVSKAIADDPDKVAGISNTLSQLLNRDEGWRNYYFSQVRVQSDAVDRVAAEVELRRDIAVAERKSAIAAQTRDYYGAAQLLRNASNLLANSRFPRGVMKQNAAKLLYMHDKITAMDLQGSAYADNYNVSRPPVLPPSLQRRVSSQAERIAEWLRQFEDKNGAILELDSLVSRLLYSNDSDAVEAAVMDLGEVLGADSRRPEKEFGRGPDNLWLFEDKAFCIEMKNEKTSKLWKTDAGQIAIGERWVRDNFPGLVEVFPIIGSDVAVADRVSDFPARVSIFTSDAIGEVVLRFRGLLVALVTHGPLFAEEASNIQRQLGPHQVLPQQLVDVGIPVK